MVGGDTSLTHGHIEMVGDTGAILFIDGGSGDSTTSDGLDRLLDWNQIKKFKVEI